jgi:hypothetical protein
MPGLSISQFGSSACTFAVHASPRRKLEFLVGCITIVVVLHLYWQPSAVGPLLPQLSLLIMLLGWHLSRVTEETLTVIEGVGIQLCMRRACGFETTRFIEVASLSDIFITETVRVHRCYFYLACLLQDAGGPALVVPFRHTLPPLRDLERVLHEAKSILWRSSQPKRSVPPDASYAERWSSHALEVPNLT